MKKSITYALVCLGLVTAPLLFTTGCAVTRGQETVGQYGHDKTITAKVKSALAADPVVKAHDVNVTTYRNDVQLSGFVDSQEQKVRAGQIAQGISGVEAVHNDLIVKTGR